MSKQNSIVRRVHVAAPIDRVWKAVTQANQLAQWFGDSAEVDLRVGGVISLGWSEYDTTTTGVVERVDEPFVFAFRWPATTSGDGGPQFTLVTFTLSESDGGTDVLVDESGLAMLHGDVYDRTLQENSAGWTAELADLVAFLGASE